MNGDVVGYALLFGWCGFSWGQRWADRRHSKSVDPALRLLSDMVFSVIDKRKIVGPYLTISVTQRFEIRGEKLSLVVEAAGDPDAIIEGEIVG